MIGWRRRARRCRVLQLGPGPGPDLHRRCV